MTVFHRLGAITYRFRWVILLSWGALLIASAFFAPGLSGRLKGGGFDGSNSEAERVQNLMSEEFGVSPATMIVVFDGHGLSARGEKFRSAEARALERVREMPEVRNVSTYADTHDPRFISRDGKKAYALISFGVSLDETRNIVDQVRGKVRSEDLDTYVT